jgi:prepilin signal peptidase PulO-like enzyme (type II secretory pathway)
VDLSNAWYAVIFVLGLIFGSFFNVAIHRWPQEDPKLHEWVRTSSHCPKCGARIRWYHNIPLISYILLGGKCRDCREPIHWRYPAVELGTALLWLGTAWLVTHLGLSGVGIENQSGWHIAFALLFASLYMLTVIIDFATGLIPDEINIAQFAGAWLFLLLCCGHTISPSWQSSLIGMFVLSLFFLILWYFGGMGLGDVLLAVGFGVVFGWQLVVAVGFLGIILGGIVAIVMIAVLLARGKYQRGIPIPFGPYLAVAAYICMFVGHNLIEWYLSFFPGSQSPAL